MFFCLRSKRGAKYEPKEYVSEYENGRSNQEDEQSGSELVPNDFPLHVLRLFLEEVRALIPYLRSNQRNPAPFLYSSTISLFILSG